MDEETKKARTSLFGGKRPAGGSCHCCVRCGYATCECCNAEAYRASHRVGTPSTSPVKRTLRSLISGVDVKL